MRQETLDATVTSMSAKAVGAGSAVTVLSWWNSSNVGMWAGVVIGATGLLINWYYKHRSDRRAAIAHEAHLRAIEAGISAKELLHMGRHAKHPDEADE